LLEGLLRHCCTSAAICDELRTKVVAAAVPLALAVEMKSPPGVVQGWEDPLEKK
jgi:hypothetical protein